MSIFQNSVVTKQLKSQNKLKIATQWEIYKNHFLNPDIQENIRNSKEEQYQGEFLIDLFVNVLGYTKNPTPNFNITTEYKNVKDSKKADGAIVINEVVKAVIELKGTNTIDLDKIEIQAFGYKNNQPECTYVITSNFEKLRFYIDNAIEHIEFNLFTLSEKDFELLYLCLAYENIENNIPQKIKKESISQEDVITKKLYNDYSLFKRELHQSLVASNPQYDALTLFKKSQKLIDRFLFLFFAEDRQLLPPNSVRLILGQWIKLKELDAYSPLFERFKKYFGYLNTGFKGKQYDVYAYNGGLFKPDEILDEIIIDDDLLYKHTLKLSEYDFSSEVDVNILGHIFENSLNELDEIKAQLEGVVIDKIKSKRKKDGVFYTPKYITKYIVENTVGKLCEEKKTELQLIEDDYITDKKRQKKTIKPLVDKLTEYRNWLLQLTICDPACGSGAFLNQALDFLIKEHSYVDELQAKLFGDAMVLSDVEKSILENNLFGVDLNEESVEIAKLSLWLRTAQPNRKLNDLNNNIKCGNSLIDDPEIAGDKAFNWQQEFPQIFKKGGFDVVIGNPPYGAEFNSKEKEFLKTKFENIHIRTPESFNYFIGQIINISNNSSFCSFIIPSSFLNQIEFEKTRKLILSNHSLNTISDLGDNIFSDVATPTCILSLFKAKLNNEILYSDFTSIDRKSIPMAINNVSYKISSSNLISNQSYSFNYRPNKQIVNKCYSKKLTLKDLVEDVATGISPGLGEAFVLDSKIADDINLENEIIKKLVIGGEINRYHLNPISNKKIIYFSSKLDINNYPNCLSHLSQFKSKLENRVETKSGSIPWYVMLRPRRQKLFDEPKILIRQTSDRIIASYDMNNWYCLKSGIIIQLKENSNFSYNYLLAILNSSLMNFLYQDLVNEGKRIFPEVKPIQLFKLPIFVAANDKQIIFNEIVDQITKLNKDFLIINRKFTTYFSSQYDLDKLSKKLENWHEQSFSSFILELNKAIKATGKPTLSKKDEIDWMEIFEDYKLQVQTLIQEIDKTDKAIDTMVYELYGLSEEEIGIIEGS